MIQTQSNDPDVAVAAEQACKIIDDVLNNLPRATTFDYGGHILKLGEYDVCETCTRSIAEAQAAHAALAEKAESIDDPEIREHIDLAAQLMQLEAASAIIRAELHNGLGSEKIINRLLGFLHERNIHDNYDHSHNKGK